MAADASEFAPGLPRQPLGSDLHRYRALGLGETYYVPRAVSAVIHDTFAPLLIGRDPLDIENHWHNMFSLANFFGYAGAEMRAISALDIALWDIAGQNAGQPIYNLLGGRNRDRIQVYNTCVGYGKYPDYTAWMEGRAGELARSLLDQGIKAMNIWPFDRFGSTLGGPSNQRGKVSRFGHETAAGVQTHSLSNDELKQGVAVVEDIRRAVGDRMSIAIEGHARWGLPAATRIARALEHLDIMWLEEIMPPDNPEAFVRLKAATTIPLCQSERVFTRFGFRHFIEQNAADIIMPDLSWGGGLSEARKIASYADTYYLPITTHDCIGPVALGGCAPDDAHPQCHDHGDGARVRGGLVQRHRNGSDQNRGWIPEPRRQPRFRNEASRRIRGRRPVQDRDNYGRAAFDLVKGQPPHEGI